MSTIGTRLRNSNFKYLRHFLIILTSSSIFIAINGCLKTLFSYSLYGIDPTFPLILATFLSIFSVYGLNKITDSEEDELNAPERSNIVSKNEKLLKYSVVLSYVLAAGIGLYYGWKVLLILLFPLLAGIIYSIKFHPKIPRLKDIFGVKSLIVALSWTVGNTFLPIANLTDSYLLTNLLTVTPIFFFFFTKSFINTVLFDLMDIEGDKKIGAMTIPVVIGRTDTIKLLLILNTLLSVLMFISIYHGLFSSLGVSIFFCIIYGYFYIHYFNNHENRFQMDILVDGEWILVILISLMKIKV